MKFTRKFTLILSIVILLGLSIQYTRLNTYLKLKTNDSITSLESINMGEKLNAEFLSNINQKKFLIVYDEELKKLKENIAVTLDYMNQPYKEVCLNDFNGSIEEEYKNIILAAKDINQIDSKKLFNYIYEGKNLFIASNIYNQGMDEYLYPILGIESIYESNDAYGIKFLENFMANSKGFEIKDEDLLSNGSTRIKLTDKPKVYALSQNNIPLIWSNKYGKGNILNFNGSMLSEKSTRGVISGAISNMDDIIVYPIINAKLNYIDDFPSPAPDGVNENIYEKYNLDISRFYKEVWWADMLNVANECNVKYTGVFIGSYNDVTSDIDNVNIEIDTSDFQHYLRELFLSGGELGIHGYNHQPLTKEVLNNKNLGYKSWDSDESMVKAIEKAVKYIKENIGDYSLSVYVPPSNIIKEDGIQALKKGNKEFKILASLSYASSFEDEFKQELEIRDDGIINMPRFTSGYEYTDENKWDLINGITLYGYVAHFIHPDDILDGNRNGGLEWGELSKQYLSMQKDLFNNYPWLEAETASKSANKLITYLNTKIYYESDDNGISIYCDNFTNSTELFVKTKRVIKNGENCDVRKIDEGTYLVKANSSISRLNF